MKRWTGHGLSGNPVYWVWSAMIQRCTNPNQKQFKDYGGRGITVCERWINSPVAFIEDMGPRPPGGTIERKDNAGNYEPDNCVWAPRADQMRNNRRNVWVEIKGETMVMQDWCKRIGIARRTVSKRLSKGMSIEDALFIPVDHSYSTRRRGA